MNESHLDPDLHLWEAEPPEWWDTMKENCNKLLSNLSCENWGRFYRAVYKGTPCGPTIGILCHGQDDFAYNDDLYKFGADSPVVKISISSIVEGSDAEVPAQIIDFKKDNSIKLLWAAIEDVNLEAIQLWQEANLEEEMV